MTNYRAFTHPVPQQALTSFASASHSLFYFATDLSTLSLAKSASRSAEIRIPISRLTTELGEITDSHLVSKTSSQSRRLANSSVFFTTSKDASNPTALTQRRLPSNFARSRERSLERTRFHTLSLTTAEPSVSPIQTSRRTTLLS